MDEITEASSEPVRHKSYMFPVYVLLIVIIGVAAGWYLYHGQNTQVSSLTSKNASLNAQVATINAELRNAKSASNVTTANWKTYCDSHGIFCFKYPSGWIVNDSYVADIKSGNVTITNPSKTLSINYQDNYQHDGFSANFIFYSGNALKIGDNNLGVFGGYYVGAVEHTPFYAVLNVGNGKDAPALSNKPGQDIYIGSPAGFLYSSGAYTSSIGIFTVQPTNEQFLSTQQADAWFNSIDGKTAYLIASSMYEQ